MSDDKTHDEKLLLARNPAMFRNHPFYYIGCLILIVGPIVAKFVLSAGEILSYIFYGLTALGALILFFWWVQVKGTRLTLTDERIVLRTGILSKQTTEVYHADVRNVNISQSFFQRIFNVGSIGISSAAQSNIEIQASGIPKPQEIGELINQYRRKNRRAETTD